MVVFFFHVTNGRTKYDELFGSAVVDTYSLKRPIYSTTPGGNNNDQFNNPVAAGFGNMPPQAPAAVNRPQFRVG